MIVRIDPSSSLSPSDQLVAQIAASIDSGALVVGERLPTIRVLAADLGLAPGTVARAYTELERDRWLNAQGRRGTTVADRKVSAETEAVADAATVLASLARKTRLSTSDAHRALDLAFARLGRT